MASLAGTAGGQARRLVVVTNFNRNFTGVSATAAQVATNMSGEFEQVLCGVPLPGCSAPVSLRTALRMTRGAMPPAIWHVRRNSEMRAAIFARDVLRLPIRIVFTSAAQRRHSAIPRWLISRMDAVIATTEKAASFVGKVRAVAPHCVDTTAFRPAANREAVWAASGFPGRAGVAAMGRIRPEKGTDVFVDAMIAALPKLPGVTALVIGRAAREHASFQAELEARVASAGLADRIIFPGEMPQSQLRSLLPSLSLVVAPPRYEGYGMTVLEAMAAGVPTIATDTGHFSAFIHEGVTGHVVPVGDADRIGALAVSILADRSVADRMGRAARERAVVEYPAEREAEAVRAVYEALWREAGST